MSSGCGWPGPLEHREQGDRERRLLVLIPGVEGFRAAVITPAVLWQVVEALDDGVTLVYDDGALALANRRLAEMSGYERAELIDQPVESLLPAVMRAAHRRQRRRYAQKPCARPMAARARLAENAVVRPRC